ncbi:uncharacterized protein LOC112345931 [Selaginella moellendorffii]|uniref:uncharacterized protein LOC112345931 n=1 Tax=Selaginella moellendorffii TaxID=88036 RepID=UPI000D1C668B|nr:uncharacterized protein LOC112345931 [Selaginella moellendorffii]|eukprot:XP_024529431.1 uncharacterized protein LOC112345931 [Selaginella moellendorffii]
MEAGEDDESASRPFTARIRDSAPAPTCQLLLSMVDEALAMMKCLTYVSEKTLEKLELSKGSLDSEAYAALNEVRLCSVAYEAASGPDIPIKEKELSIATWRACRLFSTRGAALNYFFSTREEQSKSLSMFFSILEKESGCETIDDNTRGRKRDKCLLG